MARLDRSSASGVDKLFSSYDDANLIKQQQQQQQQLHVRHQQNMFAFDPELHNRSWLQTIADSSHLITFGISILVIIYGSFRSLSMDRKLPDPSGDYDDDDDDDDKRKLIDHDDESSSSDPTLSPVSSSSVQTIDSVQALFIPVVASFSLLFMFFFFDSIQTAFVICTSVLANIAFYYLLCPMFQNILKSICSSRKPDINNVRFNLCGLGAYSLAETLSLLASFTLVIMWILTGHWLLMNIIGIGFCITFIAIVRLPSLKVSTLLLVGLVVYDVVWVYFSHFIFSSNVMVKVATKEADNPVAILARKFNIDYRDSPKLSLPGKLVVPSYQHSGNFSILGLGDIVVPGLLLCFVLRFDAYKRSQMLSTATSNETEARKQSSASAGTKKRPLKFCASLNSFFGRRTKSSSSTTTATIDDDQFFYSLRSLIKLNRISYFHCSLIGYFVGLITATLSSEIFREAQPALLFLVPFTLLPLLIMAYIKGDLRLMWNEPFNYKSSNYFYV